jgi:hypothetical protein
VRLVELDADGEGVVTFIVPVSQGLELEDYEDLLSKEERDEALVRRKLMTEAELEEAMLEPYEENPRVAEEDAYEDELVGKLVRLWLLLMVMGRGSVKVLLAATLPTRTTEPRPALEVDL